MFFREKSDNTHAAWWQGESARWGFLAAVAIWIFRPFATSRFYGTGDALWYSNMLADFVLQWRAGIFPVWVGQTEYAFNGAVYPLRVAPMYQHVGGVLDLLTLHRLTFFELQHLIVIVMGVAGIISCYACLVSIAPRQRWAAALLTTLYITCPGVLGLIFIQDLYMSWMTVPFLPVAVYGMVRSFEIDDLAGWLAIAIGLGGCWLGHAPIAMWMTAIVGAAQLIRLLTIHRRWVSWRRALFGTALLIALAQYPFVSVATLHAPGAAGATSGSLEHPERIVQALRTAFPGSLRPMSAGAGELSDLQLGYGLLVAALVAAVGLALRRNGATALLLGAAVGIMTILVPIPRWTDIFWLRLVPEQVRVLTFYWPMHRLYIVLAVTIAFACAVGLARFELQKGVTRGAMLALAIGCLWSVWESRQFLEAAHRRTATALDTERKMRPENRLLMAHAYGLFAKLPPYFSHGVLDPNREFRLTDRETGNTVELFKAADIAAGTFRAAVDANPGILNLKPSLTLEPRKRYYLEFSFSDPATRGILQLIGPSFFREYTLPSGGEPLAFGAKEENSHVLYLWTTSGTPERVDIRYIPRAGEPSVLKESHIADYRFGEIANSPLVVKTWLPLSVTTTLVRPALLETPKMYLPNYIAQSDGLPASTGTLKSGLLTVTIPEGLHEINITYIAPLLLVLSYAIMMIGCLLSAFFLSYLGIKRQSC